ncbi:MAG: hypothetical protein GF344_03190 [Chitinivibrionales bacterium]|nr:hypothetical protein [Chitinivibrionales bacterium]MBD3356084.1 hypothetical protein [Chitinivibrionales bacterium]
MFIDMNHVELLNTDNDATDLKKVIVTPLHAYYQPLIRYDLNDLALPGNKSCPCGRGYPLMQMRIGRLNDCLIGKKGLRIYPSFFVHLLDGEKWIRNYQFRQRTEGVVELDLEIESGEDHQEALSRLHERLLRKIGERMGNRVELAVSCVDQITRTTSGKYRHVISEVQEAR